MLNLFVKLSRGLLYGVSEKAEKHQALTILSQQVRDAGASVRAAQKAVALVKAQNEQERRRAQKISTMIVDLETRAQAALQRNENDLAREAAEAIAVLEDERDASVRAQADNAAQIERLTSTVRTAQARFRDLQRGQRVVTARDQVRKVGAKVSLTGEDTLADAENTLARIQDRQEEIDLTETAYAELTLSDTPSDIVDRLAAAGCGKALVTTADDVLARLKLQSDLTPSSSTAG